MNLAQEYSTDFDNKRQNRVKTSYYKYGATRENFGNGLVNALASHEGCIAKYNETGNTEYLLDAANYLMFEYMYPQHPKAYFKATDSCESAGIVGMSINEIKDFGG